MIRRPPRSTLFPYTTALPISLGQHFGDETFSKWLRPLKLVHFDACNLYLEAQNSFQIEWFEEHVRADRKSTRLNSSHSSISYAVFCLKKKKKNNYKKKYIHYITLYFFLTPLFFFFF